MKLGKKITFGLSTILACIALQFFSYPEGKVARLRLEHLLAKEQRFIEEEIAKHCNIVSATEDTAVEKYFLERFVPPAGKSQETKRCTVSIQTASSDRFYLRNQWIFSVQLLAENGTSFLERTYHVEFPTPLCLLPIALFLLALIHGFRPWRFRWTLILYLFLLGGANLIRVTNLCLKSAMLTFSTDQTFIGLALILLWVAIHRSYPPLPAIAKAEPTRLENAGGRLFSWVIGLWNPASYTVLGRLLFPIKGGISKMLPFLDGQLFVASLSLYLLSFELADLKELVDRSLWLPRYFTFTALLIFAIRYIPRKAKRQTVLWRLPRFWRSLLFIILFEVLAYRFKTFAHLRTLTRIGLGLVIGECIGETGLSFFTVMRNFLPWVGALFLASFLGVISQESGLTDLALAMWDPRIHPTGIVLYTFLAGIGLGFLTGSFSSTFFALFTFMMHSKGIPLVRAALLDGVLAGSLLSPFSLYNLLPAVQFGTRLGDFILFRFKQLTYPLVIGMAIYAVSAITSVSILQPVTFVFLVLVAVAFQLKNTSWKMGDQPSLTLEAP